MAKTAETKQPALSSRLLVEGDSELVALVKELDRLHGAAVVIQDDKGRNVPVRVNTSTLGMEVYRGGKWQPVGSQAGAAAPEQVQRTVVIGGSGGGIQSGPIVFDSAVTFNGPTKLNNTVLFDNNSTSTVDGNAAFSGPVQFTGAVSCVGPLEVTHGAAAFQQAQIVQTILRPEEASDTALSVRPNDKDEATATIGGDGSLAWGSGDDPADTELYRDAAATLKTPGNFSIGGNVILPTTTGTQIGTATNQLLGFYGATPVNQPETVADPSGGTTVDSEARTAINAIIDRLQELGLIA